MTTRFFCSAIVALGLINAPASARAQGAPSPKLPVTPPPAPIAATPASQLVPPDSAIALCNDGTWVKEPRTVADCAARGGLRVALPPRQAPPAASATSATAAAQPLRTVAAPTRPIGATMQCKDGTFLTGAPSAARCAQNGGVAAIFPPTPATPPAPARRP